MQTQKETSDKEIIHSVIAGDIDKYSAIIKRYEYRLLRYVTYLIHDTDMAEDVVQVSFIKAYQNLQSYKSTYAFSSWLYRIAHNEAMNAVRSSKKTSSLDEATIEKIVTDSSIEELTDKKMLNSKVHECLMALDLKYREVIQLFYFENLKYEEISDVLHIPRSTVGVWASRAKKKLHMICTQKGYRS